MGDFAVEVEVRVEPERVWKALTERDQISQWFGWDAPTLNEEIEFIFFEHATPKGEGFRVDFDESGQGDAHAFDMGTFRFGIFRADLGLARLVAGSGRRRRSGGPTFLNSRERPAGVKRPGGGVLPGGPVGERPKCGVVAAV